MIKRKKLELSNNIKNKLKIMQYSKIYANKIEDELLDLYYLNYLINYKKSENTQELALAIMYLRKIICFFY